MKLVSGPLRGMNKIAKKIAALKRKLRPFKHRGKKITVSTQDETCRDDLLNAHSVKRTSNCGIDDGSSILAFNNFSIHVNSPTDISGKVENKSSFWNILSDDLVLLIFSFVSYAPGELEVDDTDAKCLKSTSESCELAYKSEHINLVRSYNKESTMMAQLIKIKSGGGRRRGENSHGSYISPFREDMYYYNIALVGITNTSRNRSERNACSATYCLAEESSPLLRTKNNKRVKGSKAAEQTADYDYCSRNMVTVQTFGALTHVLPLVCKDWYVLCNSSDALWGEAMTRLIASRDTWRDGLQSYVDFVCTGDDQPSDDTRRHSSMQIPVPMNNTFYLDVMSRFVDAEALGILYPGTSGANDATDKEMKRFFTKRQHLSHSKRVRDFTKLSSSDFSSFTDSHATAMAVGGGAAISSTQIVFRKLYLHLHSHVRLPVFYMPTTRSSHAPPLHQPIMLHLFEPRYRLLVSELMSDRSDREKNGLPLAAASQSSSVEMLPTRRTRPRFIFAYEAPLARGSRGCVVEVARCVIFANGTSDVAIVPIGHVALEDVIERPNSGRLFDALVPRIMQT